jgi:pyridoxal phosphate enzyme (YggS family)
MSAGCSVAERVRGILQRIEAAAARAGREASSVRLLGVTKTVEPDKIREAFDAGLRLFGENYLQEALSKMDRLPSDVEWHMIGHLQSNKARRAVEAFAMIQSLDRPSLAEALEKAAAARGIRMQVLLQVNLGDEATKSGCDAASLETLARRSSEWPNLDVRGLMALPPYLEDSEEVRPFFRRLKELAERLTKLALPGVEMKELSMGMSHDFEVAIEEGATIVRVGSALFGERG